MGTLGESGIAKTLKAIKLLRDEVRCTQNLEVTGSFDFNGDVRIAGDLNIGSNTLRTLNWSFPKLVSVELPDLGSTAFTYFIIPIDGYIRMFTSIAHGVITGSDVDIILTRKGRSTSTHVVITMSGAAGDMDFAVLDYTNAYDFKVGTVFAGDMLSVWSNGLDASSNKATILIEMVSSRP